MPGVDQGGDDACDTGVLTDESARTYQPAGDAPLDTRSVLVQLFNTVARMATAEDLRWAAEWFRRVQEEEDIDDT